MPIVVNSFRQITTKMNLLSLRPVNLGNPVERSIQEFAEIIRDAVGSCSKIVHEEPVQDDPQKRRPDISRAKRVRVQFSDYSAKPKVHRGACLIS